MTTERPNISPTGRYPIGKAAQLLGVCRDTLRSRIADGTVKCKLRRDNLRKSIPGSELLRYWESSL